MQRYEQLISNFLVQNGNVSLENIGHLSLKNEIAEFDYDRKAKTSEELIDYVADKMKKNKLLVGYDLQSHLEQARQFIHLGKPYVIPNYGGIALARDGSYVYKQDEMPKTNEEEYLTEEAAITYEKDKKKKGIMLMAILLLIFIVGVIGYGIFYVVTSNPDNEEVVEEPKKTDNNDNGLTNSGSDTSFPIKEFVSKKPDSLPISSSNSSTIKPDEALSSDNDVAKPFKFIFEQTRYRSRAVKRTDDLIRWGKTAGFDSVIYKDTILYRLYLPVSVQPADTARIKDSLQKYFQRSVKIE